MVVDGCPSRLPLSEADIHVNFREGGTQIRIGSALFNVQAELDAFLAVMKELKG